MKKQTLTLDVTPEFHLLALVTTLPYYRLCYFVNKHLSLDFVLQAPIAIQAKADQRMLYFYFYEYYDPLEQMTYKLFINKHEGSVLIPELKRVDYFLILEGEFAAEQSPSIASKLEVIPAIQGIYEIDPADLRSWQNLLTE